VVSVLSKSPWLPRNLKNVQNETTKCFSVGNKKLTFSLDSWFKEQNLFIFGKFRKTLYMKLALIG